MEGGGNGRVRRGSGGCEGMCVRRRKREVWSKMCVEWEVWSVSEVRTMLVRGRGDVCRGGMRCGVRGV